MTPARLALLLALTALPAVAPAAPRLPPVDAARISAAVKRLAQAPAGEFRFAVVEDEATTQYVQFGSVAGNRIEADFPISGAMSPHPGDRVYTDQCSEAPIRAARGEKPQRHRSPEEEARLVATLDRLKLPWRRVHCIEKDVNGARAGFIVSIVVPVKRPEDAPGLVERVFVDVYRLKRFGPVVITTEE